jgi:hypothetical protein
MCSLEFAEFSIEYVLYIMCFLQNVFSVLTSPIDREGCAKASAALIMHVAHAQVSLSLARARALSLRSPSPPLSLIVRVAQEQVTSWTF